MMVEVRFTAEERKLLMLMTLQTLGHSRRDPELRNELLTIAHKLQGNGTELVAKRRDYWTAPKVSGDNT